MFPLSLVLVVSLAFSVEYSKGQSITDVSKFTTRSDIGTEEEPTINDDAEEEEIIQDDETETETEPTDEEENDTVTRVPPKRPTGTDLGLNNLTTAPLEEPGKLIFSSCKKTFSVSAPAPRAPSRISCNVPGASPGDNVVVSSTKLDGWACNFIAASQVSEPDVVSILLFRDPCAGLKATDTVTFSIIVFRPEVPDIIGTLEELRDKQ